MEVISRNRIAVANDRRLLLHVAEERGERRPHSQNHLCAHLGGEAHETDVLKRIAKSLFAIEKQFLARQRLSAPLGSFEAGPERPLLNAARLVIIPAGDEVAMQQREAAHVPGGLRRVLAQFERVAKTSDGFRGSLQLHQGDGALMEPVGKFVGRRPSRA